MKNYSGLLQVIVNCVLFYGLYALLICVGNDSTTSAVLAFASIWISNKVGHD